MEKSPYKRLAERLDAIPNGFPPTDDGVELRLLAKIFTREEAALAAKLRMTKETPAQIADRIGGDAEEISEQLRGMVRKGLIGSERTDKGRSYSLLPFAVGFYENQNYRMDAEFARLFEDYYLKALGHTLTLKPSGHRVVPVGESVRIDMEVQPFESAIGIVDRAKAWGVWDCICRKQKELIGEPCEHPVDVCMVFSQIPGAFDRSPEFTALTRDESLSTLQRADRAGLVHTVSNQQREISYICNCCTCSCGFLRGMADLGLADVVVRSPFVNKVDENLCVGCDLCLEYCQFESLSLDGVVHVDENRCVGCGVCVPSCPDEALGLVRRQDIEISPIPVTEADWRVERAAARGLDLEEVV